MLSRFLRNVTVLAALLFPPALVPQNAPVLSLYYGLQQTEADEADAARLESFLKERLPAGGAAVVQGFGCDTGGFERSLNIARKRGRRAVDLVKAGGVPAGSVLLGQPVVYYGEPRTKHRRIRLELFSSVAAARAGRQKADARARRINAETKRKLDADEKAAEAEEAARQAAEDEARAAAAREAGEQTSGANEHRNTNDSGGFTGDWPKWIFRLILVLVLLLLLLLLYLLYERYEDKRKRESHQLSTEEAEALEVLTGGAVAPVAAAAAATTAVAVPAKKRGKIASKLARSLPKMAKKKAKKETINPVNIKGAVDKAFEGQTLNQIRKAPIHALEGLTPRHATLLKEGFGIDTIEDLAKLKYFEIAKAITVLAKYEK